MLAKIAPRFVISGVIQNAYYANYMAVELTKHIIGDSAQNFALNDPKHYYVSAFLCRNVIFMVTSQLLQDPLSLLISTRLKNTMKPCKNLQFTTKSEPSITP